jgi:DNA topoisomerase I
MGQLPVLSHLQHRKLDKDHRQAAKAAHLQYVNDKLEGIQRKKKGDQYTYTYKNKPVRDKDELMRIKKLAIPPSWDNVWISRHPAGHIQATGTDLNGRKQYRYHASWNSLRNETKFHRMLEFGKALPLLRKRIAKDLAEKELTANKVVATAIRLMEETHIRVGNNGYEKLYGSYGLTTLKDKHVVFKKNKVLLSFTGKKGIDHAVELNNKKLANIIKQCRDIPGKQLFQYYDKSGEHRVIDSGMVNAYIKEATADDFSAKDFRTWAGSLQAIQCFCETNPATTPAEVKQNVIKVLDMVSAKLGNTRTVCKKYYVHPVLLRLYEENKLAAYLGKAKSPHSSAQRGLSAIEKILMRVLKRQK